MCSLTYEIITTKTKGVTDYDKIKKLNCWASNLTDVSILKNLPNIEVLTLSVNNISSLESVQYCVNLTELYIRNNKISNLDEVFYLKNLKKLKILWLADNPAALNNNYRLTVIRNLNNLQKLDNITITNEERANAEKFGKDIKEAPFQIDKQDSNENLLDIICSTQEFDHLIQPLKDRLENNTLIDEQEENNTIAKANNENDAIVTELLAENNTILTTIELNTLDLTSDCNYSSNFEINLQSNKSSNEKLSSVESNDESQKTNESTKASGSNVLPAILLLLNELNSDDLQILANMCLKRRESLLNQF